MNFRLTHLNLLQFRNHREAALALGPQVNCLTGPNGTGKTNLLDAVHYLSMCKSYFEPQDMHNVLHGEEWFMVKGTMETADGDDVLSCAVRKGHRKVFTRNHKEYGRLADHVGRYPVVMITPYDSQLVLDGSEVRRRFLDGLIAQFNRDYLEQLLRYNRALAQRNLLFKQAGGALPRSMAEPWDEQLIAHGEAVHAVRASFMAELAPLLQEHYSGITSGPEQVAVEYRSELAGEGMRTILERQWQRDLQAQHTTGGIHKDDLLFGIDGRPLRKFGSQGQQKTFLIALKLAQFDLTAARSGTKPLLLLDDIFDKIDPQRMRHLLALLGGGRFSQVIITDTDAARLHKALDGLGLDTCFFHLDHGGISADRPQHAMQHA
ncbi:MAG: DNA replication/repair protein RecF [Bacteroidetes bacterium]|nr:DNA replication/repair protein RecF [Bacteroidota bacterium]MBS1939255.1 DNA replication/repair protein RecF [Bacteroidota bacterium]